MSAIAIRTMCVLEVHAGDTQLYKYENRFKRDPAKVLPGESPSRALLPKMRQLTNALPAILLHWW